MRPSELIRLALRDLAACEADPRFDIDMSDWKQYDGVGDVCHVCLAGSVMVQSLDSDRTVSGTSPFDIDPEWKQRLYALENFRTGRVNDGLRNLCLEVAPDREVTRYEKDSAAFRQEMEQMADELEGKGL